MKKVDLEIKGMTCGGCTKRVEESLSEIKEAKNILVSLRENKAFLEVPDDVSESLVKFKVKEAGYEAIKIKFKQI